MKLGDLAHTRTGDKGNLVNVSVIAYEEREYPRLARHVTAARVVFTVPCEAVVPAVV